MFEKNLAVEFLLDFYGEVLPPRTRDLLGAYYGEDLSLAEIAEGEGISRQGVRHILKRGEEELFSLEEKLGLAARHGRMMEEAKGLRALADRLSKNKEEDVCALCRALDAFLSEYLEK